VFTGHGFSVGQAVRASVHSLDDGESGARARLAFRISVADAHRSVAPSLSQVTLDSCVADYTHPWGPFSLGAPALRLFHSTGHEAMTSTESCHAHRKWRDVCFPERQKQEVFVAASRDGFTAVRKTNALHTSFTRNCGSFAEYRVNTRRIALKIPPSTMATTCETHMNTLSSKLTAFAAALAINGLGLSVLGYLFALQSQPNMSAISFAKAVVAQQWLG
jgi:hypothetical protein